MPDKFTEALNEALKEQGVEIPPDPQESHSAPPPDPAKRRLLRRLFCWGKGKE